MKKILISEGAVFGELTVIGYAHDRNGPTFPQDYFIEVCKRVADVIG